VRILLVAVVVVAWMMLITAVARDMDSRGLDGRLYGMLMLALPIGLVVWLVKRSQHPRVPQES
jgi:hypothetical protein